MATASKRGGGSGETADMRAKILNSINNWADGAKWEDRQRAERVLEKMNEAPEKFISPNPETSGSYKEEASRIWEEIKSEYGLRTKSDLAADRREYDRRADDRLQEEIREQIETYGLESVRESVESPDPDVDPECLARVESVLESEPVDVYHAEFAHYEQLDPESGELADPDVEETDGSDFDFSQVIDDPEPESEPETDEETADVDPESEPAGADPSDVRESVESVKSVESTDPVESEPEPETDDQNTSNARVIGRIVGRRTAAAVRSLAGLLALAAAVLAPIVVAGAKEIARFAGVFLAFALRVTFAAAVFSLKLVFAVVVGFAGGLFAELVR